MSKKKKNKSPQQAYLSPEKHISLHARKLPITKCLINNDWQEASFATIVVVRQHVNGHVTAGLYSVDLLCEGLNDTMYLFNVPMQEVEALIRENWDVELQGCEYELAHNIIYGGIEYAAMFDLKLDKMFRVSQYILEEDDEKTPLMENIPFGDKGKPAVRAWVDDPKYDLVRHMVATVGAKGFKMVAETDELWDELTEMFDLYDQEEEEDKALIESIDKEILGEQYLKEVSKYLEEIRNVEVSEEEEVLQIEAIPLETNDKKSEEFSRKFDDAFNRNDQNQFKALYDQVLKRLEKNPELPYLYLDADLVLSQLNEKEVGFEKFEKLHSQAIKQLPEFCYFKLRLAEKCLYFEKFDLVPVVFDHKFSLSDVFPKIRVFPKDIALLFWAIMALYFLHKNDLARGEAFIKAIKEKEEDYPIVEGLYDVAKSTLENEKLKLAVKVMKEKEEGGL